MLAHHCLQFHGVEIWALGRFGVLIFFVHTSLVLTLAMERRADSRRGYFLAFYIQRAFRIYPLAIVCVLTVVALRIPPHPSSAYLPWPGSTVAANLLLIQNFFADHRTYWTTSVSAPLWSLPYEVQMYAVLPPLFWLLRRRPSGKTVAWIVAGATLIASVERWILRTPMGLAQFAPCFAGGVLAYWLRNVVRRESRGGIGPCSSSSSAQSTRSATCGPLELGQRAWFSVLPSRGFAKRGAARSPSRPN